METKTKIMICCTALALLVATATGSLYVSGTFQDHPLMEPYHPERIVPFDTSACDVRMYNEQIGVASCGPDAPGKIYNVIERDSTGGFNSIFEFTLPDIKQEFSDGVTLE